jgi:hypothetical protein
MPLHPDAIRASLLEGEVVMHREADGRVVIEQAPPTARMSLELLVQHAARHVVRLSGNRIRIAGQVVYRVVGWDAHGSALLLEREADGAAAWPAGFGTKGA